MGTFKIVSHTADAGFQARGASLSDLFETAARAMFSIEFDLSTVAFEVEVQVKESGGDLEELLYAWLSELLWLHDTEGFIPGDFLVHEVGTPPAGLRSGGPVDRGMILRGSARGRLMGDWFEQSGPQLKAVTMHGLEVRPARGGYEATVYVDV